MSEPVVRIESGGGDDVEMEGDSSNNINDVAIEEALEVLEGADGAEAEEEAAPAPKPTFVE